MRLRGKIAIITGAASGIDQSVTVRFPADGVVVFILFILDLNERAGLETAEAIGADGGDAIFRCVDVSREDHWAILAEEVSPTMAGSTCFTTTPHASSTAGMSCRRAGRLGTQSLRRHSKKCSWVARPSFRPWSHGAPARSSTPHQPPGSVRYQTSAAKDGVIQLIWSIAVDFEHRSVRDRDYLSDETVVFKKVIRVVCRSNPALPNQSRSESQR